ncbi:MAG: hypothetical protein [Wendovervirus sonii]|uniref:Uncharacterized protein n=1 Tax=phage Lak_Megaphage_Sonny TaxID=3109229 RepID=A0ABZ0Z3Z2_9CAUD|nr:MAG: hypothetical protein [phage Lak_Megaphage_Sonny]
MKAIKATKKQFDEFRNSGISGKDLYMKMMKHFQQVSPDRSAEMARLLKLISPNKKDCLFKILEVPRYVWNENAYMLKGRTIDKQKYVYMSTKHANNYIHYVMHDFDIKYPDAFYISETLDYLNTYLCTYNLK